MEANKIEISLKNIVLITLFFAAMWALFLIREVIILLFIAVIFMSALSPIVIYLEKLLKIPKFFAVVITYLFILIILSTLVSAVVSPLIDQTTRLAQDLPTAVNNVFPDSFIDRSVVQQEISNFTRNALSFTLTLFNEVLAFIFIVVLSFYLLLQREKLDQMLIQLSLGRQKQVFRITKKIEEKLGSWSRGQAILSLSIALSTFLVLVILNIPYALPLAILAGLLEVVPIIGPIISAIPAVLLALFVSPVKALVVVLAYILIQQLENHVLVPQIMRKAVGLNPLIVILAVAIGSKLLGISGGLLAVPITVVFQTIIEDVLQRETNSNDSDA